MNPPKKVTFIICLVVFLVTVISHFVNIPVIGSFVNDNDFWFLAGSELLLLLACIFKGL